VHFEGSPGIEADVLVGADGVHSVVRSGLSGPARLRYRGYTNWRGVRIGGPGERGDGDMGPRNPLRPPTDQRRADPLVRGLQRSCGWDGRRRHPSATTSTTVGPPGNGTAGRWRWSATPFTR
jgi:2-polyprenyl-6-methoxyphenol hydroxylase-like FAD-dependent oxidoreductase